MFVLYLVIVLFIRGARATGPAGETAPVAQIVQGQEVGHFTRTALQNTRGIVFLSNLSQILTSCSKMNVKSADKSADIRSICQCTEVYFILPTHEKRTLFT